MIEPLIHINRKIRIPLSCILSVIQRNKKVYVKYADKKWKSPIYAIYRGEMSNIINIINQTKIARGETPLVGIIEK